MVLKAFKNSAPVEADGDGDGIPDYADLCMDTPAGAEVSMDGCPIVSRIERAATGQEINDHQKSGENTLAANSDQVQQVLFDFDRVELKPQYYSALDEAAGMLSRRPLARVEIHGHTDNIGTVEYNHDLSIRRARKVQDYLVQKGIEKERLIPKGFGFTKNSASNHSEAGRALNRRVEILLVDERLASHHLN
jgi:OOP family OmpA-OmpF porin